VNTVRTESLPEAPLGTIAEPRWQLRDYAVLLKPRVMSLVVFTGLSGMLLAPSGVDPLTAIVAVVCIALGAGAAGAINMWYDRDIDGVMQRTMHRPLPAGRMQPQVALRVGVGLSALSVAVMAVMVNVTAALLLALTIGFYVFIYTIWLKRRTPQNIVPPADPRLYPAAGPGHIPAGGDRRLGPRLCRRRRGAGWLAAAARVARRA